MVDTINDLDGILPKRWKVINALEKDLQDALIYDNHPMDGRSYAAIAQRLEELGWTKGKKPPKWPGWQYRGAWRPGFKK